MKKIGFILLNKEECKEAMIEFEKIGFKYAFLHGDKKQSELRFSEEHYPMIVEFKDGFSLYGIDHPKEGMDLVFFKSKKAKELIRIVYESNLCLLDSEQLKDKVKAQEEVIQECREDAFILIKALMKAKELLFQEGIGARISYESSKESYEANMVIRKINEKK